MSINLVQMTATCRICGHKAHQIDTSQDHANLVVTEAMLRHVREAHPCSCGDRNRPNINHRKRIPCWTYVGHVRCDVGQDGQPVSDYECQGGRGSQ